MHEVCRTILKVVMWILIIGFGCNFIMQTISYAFYKNAKPMKEVIYEPEYIKMTDNLSGYGYNLNAKSNEVILFFGGSNYIAYNSMAGLPATMRVRLFPQITTGHREVKGK